MQNIKISRIPVRKCNKTAPFHITLGRDLCCHQNADFEIPVKVWDKTIENDYYDWDIQINTMNLDDPWSSWRLQEMSHKNLMKYITFYQNFEISLKWMKNMLIYSIHFSKTSRKCCVCSVCVHMHSFAGLIRRTFSDTAITDRHSDTTNFQLRAHWVRISWSIGSEKSFGHVPPVGVEPSTSCMQGEHPIH